VCVIELDDDDCSFDRLWQASFPDLLPVSVSGDVEERECLASTGPFEALTDTHSVWMHNLKGHELARVACELFEGPQTAPNAISNIEAVRAACDEIREKRRISLARIEAHKLLRDLQDVYAARIRRVSQQGIVRAFTAAMSSRPEVFSAAQRSSQTWLQNYAHTHSEGLVCRQPHVFSNLSVVLPLPSVL
jgi:hypothetical protein